MSQICETSVLLFTLKTPNPIYIYMQFDNIYEIIYMKYLNRKPLIIIF